MSVRIVTGALMILAWLVTATPLVHRVIETHEWTRQVTITDTP